MNTSTVNKYLEMYSRIPQDVPSYLVVPAKEILSIIHKILNEQNDERSSISALVYDLHDYIQQFEDQNATDTEFYASVTTLVIEYCLDRFEQYCGRMSFEMTDNFKDMYYLSLTFSSCYTMGGESVQRLKMIQEVLEAFTNAQQNENQTSLNLENTGGCPKMNASTTDKYEKLYSCIPVEVPSGLESAAREILSTLKKVLKENNNEYSSIRTLVRNLYLPFQQFQKQNAVDTEFYINANTFVIEYCTDKFEQYCKSLSNEKPCNIKDMYLLSLSFSSCFTMGIEQTNRLKSVQERLGEFSKTGKKEDQPGQKTENTSVSTWVVLSWIGIFLVYFAFGKPHGYRNIREFVTESIRSKQDNKEKNRQKINNEFPKIQLPQLQGNHRMPSQSNEELELKKKMEEREKFKPMSKDEFMKELEKSLKLTVPVSENKSMKANSKIPNTQESSTLSELKKKMEERKKQEIRFQPMSKEEFMNELRKYPK